jgi:hypothetical protein
VDLGPCQWEVSILYVLFNLVIVCALIRKTLWWRLPQDRIKSSSSSPHFGGASRIIRGRVEVCPHRFLLALVDVPYDLRFSSSATVTALVR